MPQISVGGGGVRARPPQLVHESGGMGFGVLHNQRMSQAAIGPGANPCLGCHVCAWLLSLVGLNPKTPPQQQPVVVH